MQIGQDSPTMLKWKFNIVVELREELGRNGTLNLEREEEMIM